MKIELDKDKVSVDCSEKEIKEAMETIISLVSKLKDKRAERKAKKKAGRPKGSKNGKKKGKVGRPPKNK